MMARPPSENPRTEFTLIRQTPAEKAAWKKAAEAQDISVAELIRCAVDQYLGKRKKRQK